MDLYKLGRWSWGLKRLSLARFQRNRAMAFAESAKNWVADTFFCHVNDAPLLPLSLDRFPPNFPRTRAQVVARETWFHIPEKFPLRDRISWKILFLGYPICDQPTVTGNVLRRFPSPSGHPMSFLRDFCWRMYRFPSIHVRKCPYQQLFIKKNCKQFI